MATTYIVISLDDTSKVDYSQVNTTSAQTMRRNVANTEGMISYSVEPSYITNSHLVPLATLTNSSLRHPLPIKASLGCKYLWKVFLITESLFTKIPTCSSIALMLVFAFYSPPSDIITIHRPPSSMYRLISCISCALNGNLGPPNKSR